MSVSDLVDLSLVLSSQIQLYCLYAHAASELLAIHLPPLALVGLGVVCRYALSVGSQSKVIPAQVSPSKYELKVCFFSGINITCTICLHPMHTACADEAKALSLLVFQPEILELSCASGCGCSCIADGGFHGYLDTEASDNPPAAYRKASQLRDLSTLDNAEAEKIAAPPASGPNEVKPLPKSLGMFAKAQIRNLTPDFTQWMSHT